MVDTYQTGEPIPDGYVHLQLVNPQNPWLDYEELRDLHGNYDVMTEHNVRYYFRDMPHGWKTTEFGVRINLEGQTITYPWNNIHNLTVVQNSQAYLDTLHEFQATHDHDWTPRSAAEGMDNYKYCPGCRVTDKELEQIIQARVDRERQIRP